VNLGSAASCLPSKGANLRCLGMFWLILVHIGMYLAYIGEYWYDLVCIGMYSIILGMYWHVLVFIDVDVYVLVHIGRY